MDFWPSSKSSKSFCFANLSGSRTQPNTSSAEADRVHALPMSFWFLALSAEKHFDSFPKLSQNFPKDTICLACGSRVLVSWCWDSLHFCRMASALLHKLLLDSFGIFLFELYFCLYHDMFTTDSLHFKTTFSSSATPKYLIKSFLPTMTKTHKKWAECPNTSKQLHSELCRQSLPGSIKLAESWFLFPSTLTRRTQRTVPN